MLKIGYINESLNLLCKKNQKKNLDPYAIIRIASQRIKVLEKLRFIPRYLPAIILTKLVIIVRISIVA
ncbi:unnamed protein product [marine sediment metagenome]|uniref:Uncharacterized protein n=1 Tax=marine sediment metagenome TaxID=412755 RepID=X1TTT0_9ZZZZ